MAQCRDEEITFARRSLAVILPAEETDLRRNAWAFCVLTLSLAGALANGCSGDDEGGGGSGGKKQDSGTGGSSGGTGGGTGGGGTGGSGLSGGTGGTGGGGTGGAAGSAGSAGVAGGGGSAGAAGTSGSGGTDASTGGTDAGSGGTDAGSGGSDAGIDAGTPVSLCGCTLATATDHTANPNVPISFAPYSYTPNCIKIKPNTQVVWSGQFSFHPLAPYTIYGTQPNPIPATSSGTSKAVTFTSTGAFGYRCSIHGQESEGVSTMCGAVFVVP